MPPSSPPAAPAPDAALAEPDEAPEPLAPTGDGGHERTGVHEQPFGIDRVTFSFVEDTIARLEARTRKQAERSRAQYGAIRRATSRRMGRDGLRRKRAPSKDDPPTLVLARGRQQRRIEALRKRCKPGDKSLAGVLWRDLLHEEEKAAKAKSYKNYRPLVVVIEKLLSDTLTALGWGPSKSDPAEKCIDFARVDPNRFAVACKNFIVALCSKPHEIRHDFLAALQGYLDRFLIRTGLKEQPLDGGSGSFTVRSAAAQARHDKEKKRRQEVTEAWFKLFATLVEQLVDVLVWLRPTDEQKKALAQGNAWTNYARPTLKRTGELGACVIVLLTTPEGTGVLNKVARAVREQKLEALWDWEDKRLDDEIAARTVLDTSQREAMREERDKSRREADKAIRESPDGKTAADEFSRIVGAIIGLIDALVKTYESYHKIFPEGLEGCYRLGGAPDAGCDWLVTLKRKDAEHYEGEIAVRGYPPPAVRFEAGALVEVNHPLVTEKKGTLTLEHVPGTRFATLTAKGLGPAARFRVPTHSDPFWKSGRTLTETFYFAGTDQLYFSASALVALTDPNGTPIPQPITLERHVPFKAWIELLASAWSIFPAAFELLPASARHKLRKVYKEQVTLRLARVTEWINKRPALRRIFEHIHWKVDGSKLSLGLKHGEHNRIAATWDVVKILAPVFEDHDDDKAAQDNPLVPEKIEGAIRIPGFEGVGVGVAWERWDPGADPKCGRSGIDDKLDNVLRIKEVWDRQLREQGLEYDLLEPVFVGDPTPGIQLPLVVYVGDLKCEQLDSSGKRTEVTYQVNAKLTFTISVGAKAFVKLFPELRALLLAWDCGWAAGTFIRSIALRSEAYRRAERAAQGWIGGYDAPFTERVAQVAGLGFHIAHTTRRITELEALAAAMKSDFYVWREEFEREGPPRRIGNVDILDAVRALLRERLALLRKDEPRRSAALRPGWEYLDTAIEAKVLLYLWGERGVGTYHGLLREIDAAVEQHRLLEPRAEVLRLYLRCTRTRNRNRIGDLFIESRRRIERWRDEQKEVEASYFAPDGTRKTGLNPRRLEAQEYVDAMQDAARWIPYLRAVSFPFPEGYLDNAFVVYRHKDGQYHWQVRTEKPHTYLRVVFYELDSGNLSGMFNNNDDYLGYWELSGQQRVQGLVPAGLHCADGTFADQTNAGMRLRHRLQLERETGWLDPSGRGTADVYVRVFDRRGQLVFDSYRDRNQVWTLTVDALGRVTNAQLRAGV